MIHKIVNYSVLIDLPLEQTGSDLLNSRNLMTSTKLHQLAVEEEVIT